jgi:hypothetical protein
LRAEISFELETPGQDTLGTSPARARPPRYRANYCTVNVRLMEWLRAAAHEVHVPETARE